MWQPDLMRVAQFIDAGVRTMREIDPSDGSDIQSARLAGTDGISCLVLQVALCAFEDPGLQQCLALLQQGLLLTYSWQGETHHTPVPPQCSSLHSLPQGLLLQVASSNHTCCC